MTPTSFDLLARAPAEADGVPLTRRMAIKLAAVAAAATTPLAAAGARADAGPARGSQVTQEACEECRQRMEDYWKRSVRSCIKRHTFLAWRGLCLYTAAAQKYVYSAGEGCFRPCRRLPPATPVPQPPITPQPTAPVSGECLNCESVGGKCCPPNGPLCACANPTLPCSRYGCPGD